MDLFAQNGFVCSGTESPVCNIWAAEAFPAVWLQRNSREGELSETLSWHCSAAGQVLFTSFKLEQMKKPSQSVKAFYLAFSKSLD